MAYAFSKISYIGALTFHPTVPLPSTIISEITLYMKIITMFPNIGNVTCLKCFSNKDYKGKVLVCMISTNPWQRNLTCPIPLFSTSALS